MSRIANAPVELPKGVEATLSAGSIAVKGSKGNLNLDLHEAVAVAQEGDLLKVSAKDGSREATAMAGTFRSLINNMVVGVNEGLRKNWNCRALDIAPGLKAIRSILRWAIRIRLITPSPRV